MPLFSQLYGSVNNTYNIALPPIPVLDQLIEVCCIKLESKSENTKFKCPGRIAIGLTSCGLRTRSQSEFFASIMDSR